MAKSDVIARVWEEMLDVPYVSASPGIRHRFKNPTPLRADTDPRLNAQPWYNGASFAKVDPSREIFDASQRRTVRKK